MVCGVTRRAAKNYDRGIGAENCDSLKAAKVKSGPCSPKFDAAKSLGTPKEAPTAFAKLSARAPLPHHV